MLLLRSNSQPKQVANASRQTLSLEARHTLRQQQSQLLLGVIQKQIEAARSTALLGGALAKACNCTLALWNKLKRFLEYSELELSNNLAENSMRPVALSRRNWIHITSALAGPKIAAILSVGKLPQIETPVARLPGRVMTNYCSNACTSPMAEGNAGILLGNGDGTFQPAVIYESGGFGLRSRRFYRMIYAYRARLLLRMFLSFFRFGIFDLEICERHVQ